MLILNALTHFITLLLYFVTNLCIAWSCAWLCVQYNVKLFCLLSGWFDKEANVATTSQIHDTITKTNGNTINAPRPEMTSKVQLASED